MDNMFTIHDHYTSKLCGHLSNFQIWQWQPLVTFSKTKPSTRQPLVKVSLGYPCKHHDVQNYSSHCIFFSTFTSKCLYHHVTIMVGLIFNLQTLVLNLQWSIPEFLQHL